MKKEIRDGQGARSGRLGAMLAPSAVRKACKQKRGKRLDFLGDMEQEATKPANSISGFLTSPGHGKQLPTTSERQNSVYNPPDGHWNLHKLTMKDNIFVLVFCALIGIACSQNDVSTTLSTPPPDEVTTNTVTEAPSNTVAENQRTTTAAGEASTTKKAQPGVSSTTVTEPEVPTTTAAEQYTPIDELTSTVTENEVPTTPTEAPVEATTELPLATTCTFSETSPPPTEPVETTTPEATLASTDAPTEALTEVRQRHQLMLPRLLQLTFQPRSCQQP
ncbi:hypothetical protein L596_001191 [Steinernema carpocapsae]|uniref:Uncharacterized protein n=1 Tax=Steinernema carpocapsae TaxID=34508 RepID=A0A4V6I7B3_STECR|nr:hypothetical protein L596_001191 [Steinernema carpocapsae]